MKKNRKILSVLVFATLLLMFATPATATDNKLLLDPIDSSGSGNGSCVNIDIYSDINEVDEAMSTQFDIEYDPSCNFCHSFRLENCNIFHCIRCVLLYH